MNTIKFLPVADNTVGTTEKRTLYIDIAKGIGILAVIAGHTGLAEVSTFHMAFFFILSGYFLTDKYDLKSFIRHRARQVLVPYMLGVLATIVLVCLKDIRWKAYTEILPDAKMWLLAGLYGKGTRGGMLIPGMHKIGAYWFLLAVFYGSVIVRKYINHKHMLPIVALIAYVGWATRQIIFLPFSIQNGMVAAFFIGVGVYARKQEVFQKKADLSTILGLSALWIFAIINNIGYGMAGVSFPYGLLNIIISLSASYLLVKLSQVIETNSGELKKVLAFYGKNSLIVLFFHALEINVYSWGWCFTLQEWLGLSKAAGSVLLFAARAGFCAVAVIIVNRVGVLRRLFSK